MITLVSYDNANGVAFGSSQSQVIDTFGQPLKQRKNGRGWTEFHYSETIVRFDLAGLFQELTFLPGCPFTLNGDSVTWDDFLRYLIANDPELMETSGFIVSVTLGVAATGLHDGDDEERVIHAFARGGFDSCKNRMRPFSSCRIRKVRSKIYYRVSSYKWTFISS